MLIGCPCRQETVIITIGTVKVSQVDTRCLGQLAGGYSRASQTMHLEFVSGTFLISTAMGQLDEDSVTNLKSRGLT